MFVNKKQTVRKSKQCSCGAKKGTSILTHDPNKCFEAMRLGSRCWAHFVSEVDDGRDLYRRLNQDKIREKALELSGKVTGGTTSSALKVLWEAADKDDWNRRAREFVDVYQ